MRFTRAAIGALLLGALIGAPHSEAAGKGQIVDATGGQYAFGLSEVTFPDGSVRSFSAVFVIPGGTVVGSPPTAGVDLTKPFAVVSEVLWKGPGGRNVEPKEVCHRIVNPTSWSGGLRGPDATWVNPPRPTWRDVSVQLSCADGSGYEAYRLSFSGAVFDGRESFVYQNGWTGQGDPDSQYWGWSAPRAANGLLHATPGGYLSATLRVCGVVAGRSDCPEVREGGSRIGLSASSVHVEYYEVLE